MMDFVISCEKNGESVREIKREREREANGELFEVRIDSLKIRILDWNEVQERFTETIE